MYIPYHYGYVKPLNHYFTILCVMSLLVDDDDDDGNTLRRWYSFSAFYFDVLCP